MTDGLVLTPSKVSAWLACEHYLSLRHAVDTGAMARPDTGLGAFARLVMDKGRQHEAACLDDYAARGIDVVPAPGQHPGEPFDHWVARARPVLAEGPPVLFQVPLLHDGMRGIADFLERVDLPSGGFTYEPVDAKLARVEAAPGHVLQLSFYADAIEAELGTRPEHLHVWLGSGRRETVRTDEVRAYWHRLRARLADDLVNLEEPATEPVPCQHCDYCEFAGHCEQGWRDADALHYVAGIRASERESLVAAGIERLAELAHLDGPVPDLDDHRRDWLHVQASLQDRARTAGDDEPPPFQLLTSDDPEVTGHGRLPEPDDGDVFLDFEGHPLWRPDGGLFFLFGVLARDDTGEWVYEAKWAHDLDEERAAAEWLVDTLYERRERHPDAHVQHYNHTERSGLQALFARHHLDDTRLGILLREGFFVDLLEVVRGAVQIGAESYGLKEVERLTGYRRAHDISRGSGAVLEYDAFMGRTEPDQRPGQGHDSEPGLARIARYNEDDVRATMAVRDWLVDIRPPGIPWRPARLDDASPNEDVDELIDRLRTLGAPEDLLVADLLGYWGREGRAHAAQLRGRAEGPEEELLRDEDAIVGLHSPRLVDRWTDKGKLRKHPGMELQFPPQPVVPFGAGMGVTSDGVPGYHDVDTIDPEAGRVVVEVKRDEVEAFEAPDRLVKNDWHDPGIKRGVLSGWAEAVADAGGIRALTDARAELLARCPSRFLGGRGPSDGAFTDDLDQMGDWAEHLDRSWMAVQGPPGTGKTYRAARMIRHLVLQGKRVGIAAFSHAAICNLLAATQAAFVESGDLDQFAAAAREATLGDAEIPGVTCGRDNAVCAREDFNVVAGTSWLFGSGAMQANPVDVLFVDEAGQLALIDVMVAGAAAHNLVLLGDPQQLPHVDQAVHPNGSGASALGHLLGDAKTLQPHQGIFLPETRRMHPDITEFISTQFYEGRLSSHASCSTQATHEGTGLRWLRADHTGRATRAPEEVDLITAEVGRLLGGPWTTHEGEERRLTEDDVMVVTPYNDQKNALRAGLADAGLRGVRVGTVDKFQGQEAPVVFFSAATSSADDAPRGVGFVFSRNRFNVAISRARCLAYLVCTEAVLDTPARTVEDMRTLSSACAFAEAAVEVAPAGSRT